MCILQGGPWQRGGGGGVGMQGGGGGGGRARYHNQPRKYHMRGRGYRRQNNRPYITDSDSDIYRYFSFNHFNYD